jgi:hypothetical protein
MRKVLLAILREGHPGILFDNLDDGTVIQGSEMAKALTSPMYGARVLGYNENATVPTLVHWTWTGNNVDPSTDFCTRILTARLDPRTSRPDQRTFRRDSLSDWSDEHRAEFFTHALTVIAGGIRAQASGWAPTYAATRYKDLNRQILWPLEYAGGADIGQVFASNMASDTRGNERAELLRLWFEIYGDRALEAKTVVHDLEQAHRHRATAEAFDGLEVECTIEPPAFEDGPPKTDEQRADEQRNVLKAEMYELLQDMLTRGVSPKGLGAILRRIVDRRFDGYWISRHQTSAKKAVTWSAHFEAQAEQPQQAAA